MMMIISILRSALASAKDDVKNKLLSGFNRLKDASNKKRDIFKKKERASTMNS